MEFTDEQWKQFMRLVVKTDSVVLMMDMENAKYRHPKREQQMFDIALHKYDTKYKPHIMAARLGKRIAIAFIAALLAALIAAMTVTAVREAIIKYYDGLYFSISDIQEPIDSSIDKNEIFNKNMTVKDVYVPYELPHGYMPTLYGPSNREPGEAFEIEYRSQTKRMIFKQRDGSVDETTLGTPIIVDGQTYYYADDVPDPEYPCELMWQADGIIFSIGGDLSADTMIDMAKSVAPR